MKHSRSFFAALIVLALAATASGHPLGTTQVVATVSDTGAYQIDLTTEAESLVVKLEAFSRVRISQPLTPDARLLRILALHDALLANVRIAFDGVPVEPTLERVTVPEPGKASTVAGAQPVIVRFSGVVPPRSHSFTWSFGLMLGSYPLVIKHGDGSEGPVLWLDGAQESAPIDLSAAMHVSRGAVAWRYLTLGFTHILPKGLDHILFVVGLFFLSTRLRPILLQVTTFTVAHSVTLALTIYGVVSLSPSIVEPLIALSIAYVAFENLVTSELKPCRVALVFGFGLLHGMGFAGVLRDLGLPRSEFMTALVTFNLGVEAGQLAVVSLALLLVFQWRATEMYRRRVVIPASAAIALTGAYWTVTRLIA